MTSPQGEVAIILINWNNFDNIRRHLAAITAWRRLSPRILIIDNNSDTDPTEEIREISPATVVIRSTMNNGFSGGNNIGFQYCLSHQIEYTLLLNHDTHIKEETLIRLLITMQDDPLIGAAGPLLQEGEQVFAGGQEISRHPCTRIRYHTPGPSIRNVPYVPGTVLLLRTAVLAKTGLFDERYFFSGEVADLCRRIQDEGYTCVVHTGERIIHQIEENTLMRERLHQYYSIRNRFLYIRKFEQNVLFWAAFWILFGAGTAVSALIKKKPHAARAAVLGVIDGITGRYGNHNEYFT